MATYSQLPPIPSSDSDNEYEVPPLFYPKPSNELPRPSDGESDVDRLETTAQRMSFGRDVGKEIQRLSQELKRNESRRSSTSFVNTSVDTVRQSAFSPEIGRSPEGSLRSRRSGSGSYRGYRSFSSSRPARPGALTEPEQEGRPLDSALVSSSSAPNTAPQPNQYEPMSAPWDKPVHERGEDEEDEDAINEGERLLEDKEADRESLEDTYPEDNMRRQWSRSSKASHATLKDGSVFRDFDGTHYEQSIHSVDGEPIRRTSEPRHPSSARLSHVPKRQSYQRRPEPPPSNNMVYYPAPVPMHLNLPKRLSQQVPTDLVSKRKSNLMSQMNEESRKSVIWPQDQEPPSETISEEPASNPPQPSNAQSQASYHKARGSMQNLPPQLRASVFFHHDSVPHDLKMKRGSAILTLDKFLDAAATAPIGEMPRVSGSDWKHKPRKSTIASISELAGGAKSRMSRFSNNRSSGDTTGHKRSVSKLSSNYEDEERDTLGPLNRASSAPMFTDNPQQSSRRAFYGESHIEEEAEPLYDQDYSDSDRDDEEYDEDELDEDDRSEGEESWDFDEESEAEPREEPRPYVGPSTLLAELQFRKQELRSRNRTAATAFPNGMHSTLLEMDAVAQIEKKKRMNARTTLAWEDSSPTRQQQSNDEDVPLGVLYPEKNSLVGKRALEDWDRPLGLIQQRDIEDNEPLSRRRNRLRGISPDKGRPHTSHVSSAVPLVAHGAADEDEVGSEHEGETLAQRTRRLKSQKALDDAIGGEVSRSRPVSSDFKTEIMSQFGGLDEEKKADEEEAVKPAEKEVDIAEETLGQRRKRLQAEATANNQGLPHAAKLPLRASASLANLLSANPVTGTRMPSNESKAPMSGLVGQSEQQKASRRQQLYEQNQLSSSNLLGGPLVNLPPEVHASVVQQKRPSFAGGQFNDGTAGATGAGMRQTLIPRQSMQNLNEVQMNMMPGMPQMQMPMGMPMGMPTGMPSMGMQMGMPNNGGYGGMPSLFQQQQFFQQQHQQQNRQTGHFPQMQIPEGYAAPGMYPRFGQGAMAFNMMNANMDPTQQAAHMSPSQRDNINRWRQTIAPLD